MKLIRRKFLHLAVGATTLCAEPWVACAQAYPTRPVRLVIPYPPGGIMDALGRPLADKMKSSLGAVVVENIGSGGGALGVTTVANAQRDGHTILLGNSSLMVISPVAVSRVSYDPIRDFEAVGTLGRITLAIVVHPSLPVHSLIELADYATRNSGKLSYGTPGIGSLNHLTGESFKLLAGTPDVVHVPYRGAGAAITDLISGHIPMIIPAINGQILEFHRNGKLRILAVTSPERLTAAPDIPTVIEAGMPGLVAQAFAWIFVPKGTPKMVIEQISHATRIALATQELQQAYTAAGVDPDVDSSADKAQRLLHDEIVRWTPVVKTIGLKFD